jgi:tricorn protease interacting factor F2/3
MPLGGSPTVAPGRPGARNADMPNVTSSEAPTVELALDVDVAGLRFSGQARYPAGLFDADTLLDAERLEVRSVRQGPTSLAFEHDALGGRLTVADRPKGSEPVVIDFTGQVETKSLYGLYRSPNGTGTVLTTHCEPTGARRIFPCVDRPDRKVRIALKVRAPADLEVVSNGRVVAHRPNGAVTEWEFEPTPPMPTYLFYLGIGQFDRVDGAPGRVAVTVRTPPGRRDAGRWAAEIGPKVLAACEAYYGIPYPLPKLDLIAISEHAFGAMENWGAITFQEARLLFDASSTAFSRRDIVETTAHEVAHQWFGNLVTMAWWDDIWLNESFAALMETKITDRIMPEFDPWTDFFLRTSGIAAALDADSLRCTHPIRAPVAHPDELSQIFDDISYGKGSAVLAMLDAFLGEETFRRGVNAYLEKFRYANARTEDLWRSLERVSGVDVGALATPWTDRPGFPVVTARLGPAGLELGQRRFTYLGPLDDEPWPIPILADVDGVRRRIRLDQSAQTEPVPPNATVHLNPGAIGFYRVLYEGPLFDRLLLALPRRPATDRWSFLNDLGAFVESGDVPWSTYVRAARQLRATDDRLVIEALIGTLGGFALEFPDLPQVVREAREFLAFASDRFGVDPRPGEPPTAGILRDRVAFARVRVDPAFARTIADRFAQYDQVEANLRSSVAIARVVAGGRAGFDEVLAALQAGGRPTADLLCFARALSWSPDAALVRSALDLAASGAVNRSHVLHVAAQASINPVGRAVVWEWLQKEIGRLSEMFRGSGYLPLLLDQAIPLVGIGRSAEVRTFFDAHPTSEGARGLAKGLERLAIAERLKGRLSTSP